MNSSRRNRFLLAICLLPLHSLGQAFLFQADSIRQERGIPGIAYAVFTDDSVLDEGVAGYRKFKSKDNLRINDRFNIGTNASAFTCFIAARLIDHGKISLDTKLLDLYPEFRKKNTSRLSAYHARRIAYQPYQAAVAVRPRRMVAHSRRTRNDHCPQKGFHGIHPAAQTEYGELPYGKDLLFLCGLCGRRIDDGKSNR